MPERLVVLGRSTFAIEVADLAGSAVLATAADADELATHSPDEALVICAEGLTPVRRKLAEAAAALGFGFGTFVHPDAVISPSAELGPGSIVWPQVVVGAQTRIGAHAILNRGALIGHHVTIGDYVTLGPGANVAGGVAVGEGALIGMGAVVLDGRRVGKTSVVGSGAVVTRDVDERVQVLGVPARVAKRA